MEKHSHEEHEIYGLDTKIWDAIRELRRDVLDKLEDQISDLHAINDEMQDEIDDLGDRIDKLEAEKE